MDDQFTGYSAEGIAAFGLDAGKMLLRINMEDPASVSTMAACADAINELASRQIIALIEPFMTRNVAGCARNDLSPDAVIRSVAIASGLGTTSAYSWLKIPVVEEMDRVVEASTLPALLLGGELADRPDEMFARWQKALALPNVRGLVVGRNLLYPPDDDVARAVDIAVNLL
jgi:DhnA family fructose-bisphosphate aldolase class Ia